MGILGCSRSFKSWANRFDQRGHALTSPESSTTPWASFLTEPSEESLARSKFQVTKWPTVFFPPMPCIEKAKTCKVLTCCMGEKETMSTRPKKNRSWLYQNSTLTEYFSTSWTPEFSELPKWILNETILRASECFQVLGEWTRMWFFPCFEYFSNFHAYIFEFHQALDFPKQTSVIFFQTSFF